jgi:DNA-binding winged helix-turn-helix (wHTH) protein
MKHYKIYLLFTIISIFGKFTSFSETKSVYSEKHLIIVLRDIGHQLLLHAKDSTSRVLPIKNVSENVYQIEFQSQFTFETDTLINLVQNRLKATKLPTEYIVSVLKCGTLDMIYGYEVSNKTGNVIPCLGRTQPLGCYVIQIQFLPVKSSNWYLFAILLIPFSFVFYYFGRNIFVKTKYKDIENQAIKKIGIFSFNLENNAFKNGNEPIELSEKEIKLLKMFAEQPNQTIDREVLMKDIWEDDGVIVVSRSLDVLVSKLRKKLEVDPNLKLVNVHGKGYKLVVS